MRKRSSGRTLTR